MSILMDAAHASDEVSRATRNLAESRLQDLPCRLTDIDEEIAQRLVDRTAALLTEAKAYRERLAAVRRLREREMNRAYQKAMAEL